MITFLPMPNFKVSALILDNKRLGKQRVETLMLLRCFDSTSSLRSHPAFQMWKNHRNALTEYGVAIIYEWIRRGYKDNCLNEVIEYFTPEDTIYPPWLGLEAFHSSHRSNLLRKDPIFYGRFGWKDNPIIPYIWPKG